MSLFLHFSSTEIYQFYSFIPIYILKIFTEGFVHISFTMIYIPFYF